MLTKFMTAIVLCVSVALVSTVVSASGQPAPWRATASHDLAAPSADPCPAQAAPDLRCGHIDITERTSGAMATIPWAIQGRGDDALAWLPGGPANDGAADVVDGASLPLATALGSTATIGIGQPMAEDGFTAIRCDGAAQAALWSVGDPVADLVTACAEDPWVHWTAAEEARTLAALAQHQGLVVTTVYAASFSSRVADDLVAALPRHPLVILDSPASTTPSGEIFLGTQAMGLEDRLAQIMAPCMGCEHDGRAWALGVIALLRSTTPDEDLRALLNASGPTDPMPPMVQTAGLQLARAYGSEQHDPRNLAYLAQFCAELTWPEPSTDASSSVIGDGWITQQIWQLHRPCVAGLAAPTGPAVAVPALDPDRVVVLIRDRDPVTPPQAFDEPFPNRFTISGVGHGPIVDEVLPCLAPSTDSAAEFALSMQSCPMIREELT